MDHKLHRRGRFGADVINIHAGGTYGDTKTALERLRRGLERLSDKVRQRVTLENDQKCYSPGDLIPIGTSLGVPLVYDVHHHRCNPDDLSVSPSGEMASLEECRSLTQ